MLAYGGDCVEGVVSQGGKLATRLDLSPTEQIRVYRRLVAYQIAVLAPLCDELLVMVVPGNHDQTSRQFATKPGDSWAIEGMSAVADALSERAAYSYVQFLFPGGEELALAVNVGTDDVPLVLGLVHGDVCGSTSNQVIPWWTKQAHGRQAVGEADILITGHWHHLRCEFTGGNKTWVQAPALDGGSDYFRRSKGEDTPAGMLTMWLTPGSGCGWTDLKVHS